MKRHAKNLSPSLEQRLGRYALAASAAGMGMLAPANVSEAKIVYTKTYEVIGADSVYPLDLNHDGTIDFLIHELGSTVCSSLSQSNRLGVKQAFGNAVAASKYYSAGALLKGAVIGSRQRFVSSTRFSFGELMARACGGNGCSPSGAWVDVHNRYLGLKFLIDGKTHYGWARLSVRVRACKITATLTGYAYETIPNKAILAGQTHGADDATDGSDAATLENATTFQPSLPTELSASLDLLALGASGLRLWRRPR